MKEKILFNMFWCLSSLVIPFLILYYFTEMSFLPNLFISLFLYSLDIKNETKLDKLNDEINLYKKIKNL